MRLLRIILPVILLLLASDDALAQRKREKNKITPETGAKTAAEREGSAMKQKQDEYKFKHDHHLEIQDKATRKRMKKTKRKAEKHSWGKDVPWHKRWFKKDKF